MGYDVVGVTARLVTDLGNGALDLIYPPRCLVCRAFGDAIVCEQCRAGFVPISLPHCDVCGTHAPSGRCDTCRRSAPFEFAMATAAGRFDGPLRAAILRLKYGQRRRLAPTLGAFLAQHLAAQPFGPLQPNVLLPVPLHPSRVRSRGFNQSELLCREIAATLSLPLLAGALVRTRRTRPQVELRAEERAANIRGAFAVRNAVGIDGTTVLLVDDVLTSMSTVNECARVLRDAGARAVLVAGVARD